MAGQSFEQILKDIRNKVFYPVYFLMGEEPFFIDVIEENLISHVLEESEKEFNLSILYAKDTDIPTVLNTAKRFPMMSSYHLVIVREAQSLRNLGAKESKAEANGALDIGKTPKTNIEHEMLLKYLENPLKTTILVFCHKHKTIGLRSKVATLSAKNGIIFESKRIHESKLPAWIDNFIQKKGYKITPKAAQLLCDHLGSDLSKVINEIQKLLINLRLGTEINPAIIEENIGISKDFNIFELQVALGTMNKEKVYRIAKYFGDNQKANPLVLTLTMLYLFFQKVMIYHATPDKSTANLAGALGINPFFLKDYQIAAKNFSPARVEKIFSYLRECDVKSKGVGQRDPQPGELLKELLFKIMH